jgi:hypothetical protein
VDVVVRLRSWMMTEDMSAKRELMTMSGMEGVEVDFVVRGGEEGCENSSQLVDERANSSAVKESLLMRDNCILVLFDVALREVVV